MRETQTVTSDTADAETSGASEPPIVVLTGGTSGIGRVATRELAGDGATVAIVGRNADRGERLAREVTAATPGQVDFYRTDLSTTENVRVLATDLRAAYDRIDVLAHNAGLSMRDRTESEEGIELTLAVNHLAPYLLTHELLDRLRASAPARVVVTASGIHRRATLEFEDLQCRQSYDALDAYARSKLANVAFTIELAERLEADNRVTANCFHPGFVPSTGLFRNSAPWTRIGLRLLSIVPGVGTTPGEGARRLVRLATDPAFADRTGLYVDGDGPAEPKPEATDPAVRERLWTESADLVGIDPDWPQ